VTICTFVQLYFNDAQSAALLAVLVRFVTFVLDPDPTIEDVLDSGQQFFGAGSSVICLSASESRNISDRIRLRHRIQIIVNIITPPPCMTEPNFVLLSIHTFVKLIFIFKSVLNELLGQD
jgi:hypothetical protein